MNEIALFGNPNSGKTSLFNELTGGSQYVGNWPGVTVEKKSGKIKGNKAVTVQDLPGIYSLSPYSPEEIVARNYLLTNEANILLNVIDGTNLERNLYLTTQLLETDTPLVVAVNMMDMVEKSGKKINLEKLAYSLGSPVCGVSATKKSGLKELTNLVSLNPDSLKQSRDTSPYDKRLEVAIDEIMQVVEKSLPEYGKRWYAIKLFERDEHVQDLLKLSLEEKKEVEEIIQITEKVFDEDSESIMINERYSLVDSIIKMSVVQSDEFKVSVSDKIDNIITNRWLGLPIFAIIMWLVYYLSIQTVGAMGTDWVNEQLFGNFVPNVLSVFLNSLNVASWLSALILDGIVAGVGAVIGFVPQLIVLFLCLGFLEDCGYMARIAFVLDRIFRKFGLSGKSFIPMLVATGCGVPGIMACRTIENEKDRRMTIITTTFMPCSAKLPIIGLIAGAFFPGNSLIAPSAYFIGIGAIVLSSLLLKKTRLFSGETAPFIMELPAYHLPMLKNVLRQTYDRAKSFVVNAGSVIFVCSIAIWFLSTFNFRLQMVETNNSILAGIGNAISWLFIPLGWGQWQATVAAIMGLVAKENIVGTFGILFGYTEVAEAGNEIWPMLTASLTPLAGFSFLVFNLLCAPCFAAIGAIKREMNDLKWTVFAIGYQCVLAYGTSLVIYQLGSFITGNRPFGLGQFIAISLIIMVVGLLVRKPYKQDNVGLSEIKILTEEG